MPNSSFANLSNMLLHGFVFESLNMSNREAKISQVLGQFSILKQSSLDLFYTNISSVTVIGAALPRFDNEKPDVQLSPELGLKGIVQRKLRWVEIGINRRVLL